MCFAVLTMMVMIFVNDLSDVRGLQFHAHMQVECNDLCGHGVSFLPVHCGHVDAIAIAADLKRNPSYVALWRHILSRSIGLIVLGLFSPMRKGDPVRMGLPTAALALLGLTGAILFWLVPSRNTRHGRFLCLRIVGFLVIVGVFAIFRRTAPGPGLIYPEILGLIGASPHFSVALLYVSTRRWLWAPLAWFCSR